MAYSASGITYPDLPLNRWGANNTTPQTGYSAAIGDVDLWIPTWSGEVMHAYDQYNVFEPMVDTRTIVNGTTIEFPVTGTIALKDKWEAGEELSGGGSTTKKYSISLDRRPIAAHFELDNIDVMREQFEFRSELARQAGLTLANERDRQISRLIVKAAKTASRLPNTLGASGVNAAGAGTCYYFGPSADAADSVIDDIVDNEEGALAILSAVEAELVKYRELDIPEGALMVAVSPAMFNEIRRLGIAEQAALAASKPSNMGNHQSAPYYGSIGGGVSVPGFESSLKYMGAMIVATNHLPNSNVTTGDANYQTDGTFVKALMFQRGWVASVKKQGLKVDSVEDVRRNTVFTVASMYSGGGILRPELASVVISGNGTLDKANLTTTEDQSGIDQGFGRAVRLGDVA
jgi:hypothetical protein